MSKNKKNSAKNPYTKSAMARAEAAEAKAQKQKTKRTIVIIAFIIAAALIVAAATTLIVVLVKKNSPSARIEKAEEYLTDNSYKLVMSSGVDCTDDAIKAALNTKSTSVTLTVDGDSFKSVIPHGDANITYLFHHGVLYIDESVANLCTKQALSDKDRIAELREEYITSYISVFSPDEYRSYDKKTDDSGNLTITLTDLTDEQRESFESSLANIAGSNSSGVVVSIDDDETRATVVLDSEGRYKSIEQVYALSMTYSDGYSALITMTAKKTYTYGSAIKLAAPQGNYIDLDGEYKDVFGTSFGVSTEVTTKYDNEEILRRLGAIGFILDSELRVDGNNFECKYPDAMTTYTLDGNKYYYLEQVVPGEVINDDTAVRVFDNLENESDKRKSVYSYHVFSNVFAANARDYATIKATTAGGITTVTCSTITEERYNYINEYINLEYTSGRNSLQLTPDSNKCTYTVKYDSEGRFLSTELVFVVKPTDMSGIKTYDDYEIRITRTFDYEAAEDHYEAAGENGGAWITAPENADEYHYDPDLF